MKQKILEEIKRYPGNLQMLWKYEDVDYDDPDTHGIDTISNIGDQAGEYTEEEWRADSIVSQYDDDSKDEIIQALSMCSNISFFREENEE